MSTYTTQIDTASLEPTNALPSLPALPLTEHGPQWGEFIDPRTAFDGDSGYGLGGFSYRSQPDDFRDGNFCPHIRSQQDVDHYRGIGRFLAECDATSIGVMANLTNYTIERGFNRRVEPREGMPAAPSALAQGILEEFLERTGWQGDGERECFRATHAQGEQVRVIRHVGGGRASLLSVDPSWVVEPAHGDAIASHFGLGPVNWKYGVATHPEDSSRAQAIHWMVNGDPGSSDSEIADRYVHWKVNVPSLVKRGLTDFFAVYEDIRNGAKLHGNTVKGAALQAAIAWIEKHSKATRQQIQSAADAQVSFSRITTSGQGRRQRDYEHVGSGRIVRTNDGVDFAYGPMGGPQGQNFIPVIQAALRRHGQRWQMPEYMVSGDASNANYASTLVAESPFVKSVLPIQAQLVRLDKRLCWIVLDIAVQGGLFGRVGIRSGGELRRAVEVMVEAPSPEVRDRKAEHELNKSRHESGLLSRETWASREDIDLEQERSIDPAIDQRAAVNAQPGLSFAEEERVRKLHFSLLEDK